MGATCKDCKAKITWAAHGGRTLPFEPCVFSTGVLAISKDQGTYRTRPHGGSPHVPAYRRHRCKVAA